MLELIGAGIVVKVIAAYTVLLAVIIALLAINYVAYMRQKDKENE